MKGAGAGCTSRLCRENRQADHHCTICVAMLAGYSQPSALNPGKLKSGIHKPAG